MHPLPPGVEHHYVPYDRHEGAVTSYYACLPPPSAPSSPQGRPPLLFISGFGVGGWHYERNLPALAKEGYACFAPDLLGQGRSWPKHPPSASDDSYSEADEGEGGKGAGEGEGGAAPLRYSVDEWVEQLRRFVVDVVLPTTGQTRVVVAGNSLGGLLSVQFSARYPELVRGVVLMNATPFWAFQTKTSGGPLSWPPPAFDGRVPAPSFLTRTIERLWWDQLRRPETVETLLAQVYSNPAAFAPPETGTSARILEASQHPAALDAFVSIALSPKPDLDFDEALVAAEARSAPLLILGGALDPWVRVDPWLRRVKRRRPDAPLWLIEEAGHCPAHESPTAVNACLLRWLAWLDQGGGFLGREDQEEGAAPPPPVPLDVGASWAFEGGSEYYDGERATVVRGDAGEPTTLLGKLERLLTGS
jgi:pimeloyl-ACP methyl ester carboxylesterase